MTTTKHKDTKVTMTKANKAKGQAAGMTKFEKAWVISLVNAMDKKVSKLRDQLIAHTASHKAITSDIAKLKGRVSKEPMKAPKAKAPKAKAKAHKRKGK